MKKTKVIIASIVFLIVVILVVGAAVIFPRINHEHVVGEITCNEKAIGISVLMVVIKSSTKKERLLMNLFLTIFQEKLFI